MSIIGKGKTTNFHGSDSFTFWRELMMLIFWLDHVRISGPARSSKKIRILRLDNVGYEKVMPPNEMNCQVKDTLDAKNSNGIIRVNPRLTMNIKGKMI